MSPPPGCPLSPLCPVSHPVTGGHPQSPHLSRAAPTCPQHTGGGSAKDKEKDKDKDKDRDKDTHHAGVAPAEQENKYSEAKEGLTYAWGQMEGVKNATNRNMTE